MALVALDLPAPRAWRGRWAALAAVCAARGWGRGCWADGSVWHYDDSGGNWLDLHHLPEGRAVLLGNDHEYSETYYGPGVEGLGEEESDLLADAPDWWRPVVERSLAENELLGFVYGFDGDGWWRAEYDDYDGFGSVGLPAMTLEETREHIVASTRDAPGLAGATADQGAVDALAAADGDVTEEHVRAVIGWTGDWDASAGAAAARRFLAR